MVDLARGEALYPVRVVIARTGVSADLLRAWERRYGAVIPRRSAGGQRLCTEEDVVRLTLLRRATLRGHRISKIARLGRPALEALLEESASAPSASNAEAVESLVAAALRATERLDATALEAELKRAAFAFGVAALVDQVVSQFMRRVGERWHEGTLSPGHEHLASAVVRRVLAWVVEAYATENNAPCLVVATSSGELHELGAMLAAAAAAEEGWRVVYLGANLPAAHVASAAEQVGARAVALSAVYLNEGAGELDEVRNTARALPTGITLLVGGAAAERHGDALRDADVRVLPDLRALRRALRALRVNSEGIAFGEE